MIQAEALHCSYSYHTQPFQTATLNGLGSYLFRLQTEGVCRALVNGEMRIIRPGDLLLYKPGDPYRLVVDAENQGDGTGERKVASGDYYLFCRGPWLDEWWNRHNRPTLIHLEYGEPVLALWRMLIVENRRMNRANPELIDYLLRALLLQIDQAAAFRPDVKKVPYVATRMRNFIEERAATPFRLDELAREAGLSVSRAVHLFKECFGMTIIQYAQEVRLAIAEERMKYSAMTLEQIAETSGFGNYSHFYKVFLRKHGIPPSEFRQRWEAGRLGGR
jgi:AraC family transcriptional regulator of arabinose operon